MSHYVADEQRRLLSNELFVTLPVDTGDIVLPADADPAHKVDGAENKRALLPADENLDDMYKEVLMIQPGSPHDGICPFLAVKVIDHSFARKAFLYFTEGRIVLFYTSLLRLSLK